MKNQETPEQAHENKYPNTKHFNAGIDPFDGEKHDGISADELMMGFRSQPLKFYTKLSVKDKISLIESLTFLSGQEFTDEISGVRRGLLSVDERKKLSGVVMKLSDQVLDDVCPDLSSDDVTAIEFAKRFV